MFVNVYTEREREIGEGERDRERQIDLDSAVVLRGRHLRPLSPGSYHLRLVLLCRMGALRNQDQQSTPKVCQIVAWLRLLFAVLDHMLHTFGVQGIAPLFPYLVVERSRMAFQLHCRSCPQTGTPSAC